MRRILLASLGVAALASPAIAQTPTTPPAAPATTPIRLDGIAAIVADQPITMNDLRDAIIAKIQRREIEEPKDSAAARIIEREILNDMIQEELIIQKAKDLKIVVADADVSPQVDQQIKSIRASFQNNEAQFRAELQRSGLGTPEEFRRYLMEQYRRQFIRDRVMRRLMQDGKIIPITVSDAEISAEFEKAKGFLPPKPASVTFKQIVIAPQPTAAAKEVARVKAESVLVQLKTGADFEAIAKRESMDPITKSTGGDLGWMRRGANFPEFDRWLFGTNFMAATPPGQMTPVFETPYGFHIVRVERVQPGEVKARQVLIVPKIDSADFARTALLADSVAKALRAGTPFDTLAKKYHDYPGKEETSLLTPFARDSLPQTYQRAFADKKPGEVTDAFQIPGSAQRPDVPKYVVAQLLTVDEGGERTLGEMREAVRNELAQRGGVRRYIDGLRKHTFVVVKLDEVHAAEAKAKPDEASKKP
jgi:peptidyl-prolyl cis-trans isomerase SurA